MKTRQQAEVQRRKTIIENFARPLNNNQTFKKNLLVLSLSLAMISCGKFETNPNQCIGSSNSVVMTHPDHIIFCFFENKGFSAIIGNADASYINSLRKEGVLFTSMHALGHPSYPEYIRFFAGTRNGVTTDDCINTSSWTIPNLYTSLAAAGKTFAWYSEDLPSTGSTECVSGHYREKHNPVTIFANVPPSANKPLSELPCNYSSLENVACITPNLIHDMHDGSIHDADNWLQTTLSPLVSWCKTHNSIFVVYYDENDGSWGNRTPVIAVGEHVKVNCEVASVYDHYNWTRTICSMFGASTDWTENLRSRDDIHGCWQ